MADTPYLTLDYSNSSDAITLKGILNEWNYMPVDLDEDCILGWAERYYKENPKASKGDFLGDASGQVPIVGEIREPKHFKGLIRPYKEKTNAKFQYLMDCLNDRLRKKDLGAFYTPIPYAEKAAELVRMAIQRVPEGNDYIILDRCAGTGNLESVLTDEELSHCILSTYEYFEYKVLQERLGDKVRFIVPPTEAHVEYANGCVMNADAMSEEYINNPDIKRYVDDPKCTIILYENPPYSQTAAITFRENGKQVKTERKNTFVATEYKKDITKYGETHNSSQELCNLFIWSGFKYYLRNSEDSYIIFAPIKYYKSVHLVNKQMIKGFAFNRKFFHASASVITCILWRNTVKPTDSFILSAYDINECNKCIKVADLTVKQANSPVSKIIPAHKSIHDVETNMVCKSNGTPSTYSKEHGRRPLYNDDIIAYIFANSYINDPKNSHLVRANWEHGISKGQGSWLRVSDYLLKLPAWVSKMFPQDNWYEKEFYYTTSDGGDRYTKDNEFLKECLIYTCLSNQNKCLSFLGSDGREYQNELCFDNSKSELPLAYQDLQKFSLNEDEEELLNLWNKIMEEARTTENYDPHWNYGVYQITKELDTYHEEGSGRTKKKVYDYPALHGNLDSLRTLLKAYYKKHITPKMFEYELLK